MADAGSGRGRSEGVLPALAFGRVAVRAHVVVALFRRALCRCEAAAFVIARCGSALPVAGPGVGTLDVSGLSAGRRRAGARSDDRTFALDLVGLVEALLVGVVRCSGHGCSPCPIGKLRTPGVVPAVPDIDGP